MSILSFLSIWVILWLWSSMMSSQIHINYFHWNTNKWKGIEINNRTQIKIYAIVQTRLHIQGNPISDFFLDFYENSLPLKFKSGIQTNVSIDKITINWRLRTDSQSIAPTIGSRIGTLDKMDIASVVAANDSTVCNIKFMRQEVTVVFILKPGKFCHSTNILKSCIKMSHILNMVYTKGKKV